MTKELIISIIIVGMIFIGNFVTENYTKKSVDDTSKDLEILRDEIIKDDSEVDYDFAKQQIDNIHRKWDEKYEKLAYYIEHDELEKAETELTVLRGYLEKRKYADAIQEIDKSIYILEHIKDKNDFNLKTIF